ncbi:hypothetical protein Tco_0938269 [Tanacetum coccineum]|uniref:Reverse transcriptase domain-containing protein n=1 Tax=Tanacetum coccineum TaxID=301880 RepID=A0ABQ5DHC7_9ASTR
MDMLPTNWSGQYQLTNTTTTTTRIKNWGMPRIGKQQTATSKNCPKLKNSGKNKTGMELAQLKSYPLGGRDASPDPNIITSAAPVARAPYRLASSEMKELAEQLQELSDKGFIRPSSSP